MATTFKEQQKALVHAQHRLAVWEFLYAHLDDNYIKKDGRGVGKALRVPGCMEDMVPEETIDEILVSISAEKILVLQKQVNDIENTELVVLDKDDIDGKNA